tara:strand:- start:2898 stop:4079 length:1182 start_codon:yes stop_codon:yes gene_type:complete
MKRGVIGIFFVFLILVSLPGVLAEETVSLPLKVPAQEGEIVNRGITVSSDEGGELNLEVVGVEGVTLSEQSLVLPAGESKEISIKLDSKVAGKGVHVGNVKITSDADVQIVPVIFEVESRSDNLFFDVLLDIPPQYTDVEPGERFISQVKIFDLTSGGTGDGLGATNVDLEYYIYSIDGSLENTEAESTVVNRQTQLTKSFNLPVAMKEGKYVFVTIAKYRGSFGSSTHVFDVSKGGLDLNLKGFGDLFKGSGLIILIFAAFFLVVIGLFVYLIKDRDKMFVEMRKYNSQEMKMQKQFLMAQQKLLMGKQPARAREIGREVKEKIVKLKEKQKGRVKVLKKLKKAGNLKQMKAKVAEWKSKGYNVLPLEYKLKGLSVKEMKGLLSKWKREYKH